MCQPEVASEWPPSWVCPLGRFLLKGLQDDSVQTCTEDLASSLYLVAAVQFLVTIVNHLERFIQLEYVVYKCLYNKMLRGPCRLPNVDVDCDMYLLY